MTTGVLVMAYGTPSGPDNVEAFYTDIRHGHPPSPAQLDDLRSRYDAIGGVSPLADRTAAQVRAIGSALDAIAPGHFIVAYGAKHSRPKIEETVDSLAASGASAIVGLVLAPHYSTLSVGEYIARARERAESLGISSSFIEHWGTNPVLIDLLAERTLQAIGDLDLRHGDRVEVVFSAHSLPVRILEADDPYPNELAETAALVARRSGIASWRTGWQSAGRTSEEWLGPDILDILVTLKDGGATGVVVCPAGFTSDHLEVCFDLDIEAQKRADELGLVFARTASLNDDPRLAGALAELAARADPDPAPR